MYYKGTVPDFKRIGQKIRQVRLDKGLTQEYLAHAANVNSSHISNIENYKAKISLATLIHVCNALEITVDYILSEEYINTEGAIHRTIMFELAKCPEDMLLRVINIVRALQ